MEQKFFTIYCSPRRFMQGAFGMKAIMFGVLMLCLSSFVQAQSVTGKVTDANGVPLLGVNVLLKNTNTGTVTDFDGEYQIQVPAGQSGATLTFSYLGYETKEVAVAGQTVINVTLAESTNALDEVVVTALGIKKESKKLGYAQQTVDVENLSTNRTTNVMQSVQGKVAGLDISPPSSGAGGSTKIRLRGQSGFNGVDNAPLIVINGLPMSQGNRGASGGNNRDRGDNMTIFNPDDVESMTVLKGATAAALYGARAANGAIIITTKSGARNQGIGVELTSSFTAQTVLDYTDYQQEYGQGTNGVRPATQGQAADSGQFGWGERLDGAPQILFDGSFAPYSAYGPDRLKGYYRTGTAITNSIALSGGGANGSFRASFSHTHNEGIDPINEFTRKIVNLGLNHNITDKLTLSINANYSHENMDNPPQIGQQGQGAANFLHRMSTSIPLSAFKNSTVDPATTTEWRTSGFQGTLNNPYYLNERIFFLDTRDRLLATISLRYQFADWLYAMGRINYDYSTSFNERNNPTGVGTSNPIDNNTGGFNGSYDVSNGKGTDLNADFLIGANKEFGDFSTELSVGGNIFKVKDQTVSAGVDDFVIRDLYSIGNGIQVRNGYGFGRTQINSLYAFADLGYKDILFLNATVRNDWFSVLNPDNNSYLYPSVGGSFIFSELLDSSWLTYGKLRATWAEVGKADGVGAFQGNLLYNLNANAFDGQKLGAIAGGSSPNPNIKPFTVTEKEIGLELRMFKSRVNLDMAVYEKTTTDQILNVDISSTSGYGSTPQNLASLQNRGFEFLLDVTPIQNDNFTWTTTFNAAFNESEVLKLSPTSDQFLVAEYGGNEFLGRLYYQVGLPLNQLAARTYERDAQGRIQVNSDGYVIATSPSDYRYFGSALPKWTGGWTNNFRYKNLTLGVFFDFKTGGKVISSTALNGLRQGHTKASLVGRDGTAPIPDAVIQGTDTPAPAPGSLAAYYAGFRNNQIGDPFIFKSDFIRLRNISLTYDLGSVLRNSDSFIKGLTLSASCRNVALLSKDIPDLDPEAFASSQDSRVGYEQTTLPTTRDFTLSVNVKF
ncbi:SusC/RagA family TonB-linked outer membrane protein [Flavobacteriaceae bacterium XHP0103]|uniref:SusC/RagA family TonB-linked outer membrane protein n=1 Tax=Marixanthotalea marina TaxID=2844359 RepID=UPI00298A06C9|nr:SusC/RagA family TonB-linked outer membrane protein [Marixanthotalea marina]MBU3822767.1 SusC/RagA family TonB-linked outer membrane protein [Marixanthotalea marina]